MISTTAARLRTLLPVTLARTQKKGDSTVWQTFFILSPCTSALPLSGCAPLTESGEKIMNAHTSKDPLHGVTLEMQINHLVAQYGWAELGNRVNINCFKNDPSVKSSLKFLRRTPWARAEVEALYLASLKA